MKKLSKFLSMILALALAFALAVPAFADSVNGYTDPATEEVEFSVAPIGVATISYFFGDEARTVTAYVFDQKITVALKDGTAFHYFVYEDPFNPGVTFPGEVYDEWTLGDNGAYEVNTYNGWSPNMATKSYIDKLTAAGFDVIFTPLGQSDEQPDTPPQSPANKPAPGVSVALNDGSGQFAYTIKYGDTLSGLAHYYYGNMNVYKLIYELNKDTIKNPNMIYAGQTIILPSYPAAAAYPAK